MTETQQTISLSLFRFDGFANRLWAFSQMGLARRPLARLPEIEFFKLFGTGTEEGFNPKPNWGVYAILCGWPNLQSARQGLQLPIFDRYRAHSKEHFTAYLRTSRCWGVWAGSAPFQVDDAAGTPAPVAVLTRATVKLRYVPAFWASVPKIQADIKAHPDLMLKIGMGEIPWVHQVTFSIWPDEPTMLAFSKNDKAHGEGVRMAWDKGWFKEQLFARFALLGTEGRWEGKPIHCPGQQPV